MDKQVLRLLRKYLDDRCTPEELEQIQMILRSSRYEEEWAAALEEDAERSINKDEVSRIFDADEEDHLLDRVIKSAGIDAQKENKPPSRKVWFAAAASILLLITAGITFFMISSVFEMADKSKTVTTRAGEQKEVRLPDGTRVQLNDRSTLSYPRKFTGNTRHIQLKGRAYFKVISDSSRPFRVETGELTVKVLGTSFDVSAYESDLEMVVTVASGRVRVTGPSSTSTGETELDTNDESVNTLMPHDRLTYNRHTRQYLLQTVPLNEIQALIDGRLIFQNQMLGDIVQALERRYNIQFRFGEEVDKDQRLTFKPNSSDPDEVLQILSLVSGLEYEFKEGEVYMNKK